jgi:predicted ribosomally synthesized peptide with nif11-like leader
MSREALGAFLKRVGEDRSLRDAFVAFAATHGFAFTADELSEADLEHVAGGASIGQPGDAFEKEADEAADKATSGGQAPKTSG